MERGGPDPEYIVNNWTDERFKVVFDAFRSLDRKRKDRYERDRKKREDEREAEKGKPRNRFGSSAEFLKSFVPMGGE